MKIKSSGALVLAFFATFSTQPVLAQQIPQAQTAVPAATAPATSPAAPAANSTTPPGEMKGNLEFDALGFKGSIHFDGNPLTVLQQQPAQTAQPGAGGAVPMQPQMVAPGQPVMMVPVQGGMMMPMQPMQPMQQMMPMQMTPMQPMAQMQPAAPAAPAGPVIDLSGVQKAANAIAPKLINALPALGLPAAPAFIDQSSKVIQQIFPGNKNGAQQPNAAMMPMTMSSAPMAMNNAVVPDAGIDVLNALDQFQRAVKYNLEMAQEAAYLASFGDPAMRATSALEAQKNANEARATADRAVGIAGNYGGEAAQIVGSIRSGAAQVQALADQARAASNNSNGLSP